MAATTCSESSLHPSPTTSTSRSVKVCRRALPIEYGNALHHCGYWLPARAITVNLSPADVKKEGSGFDLPIAIGVLHAMEFLGDAQVAGRVFAGELSLDGAIAPLRGTLSISAALARDAAVRELIVPLANANEAAAVRSVRVIGAGHLLALLRHLRGEETLAPAESMP